MILLDVEGNAVEVGFCGIWHIIERYDELAQPLLGSEFLHLFIDPLLHLLLIHFSKHVLPKEIRRTEGKQAN